MKPAIACLATALMLGVALPAAAQTAQKPAPNPPIERAKKRCLENRGADCETKEGLREWVRQERPITEEQRRAAAAARRAREGQAR